MATLRDMQKEMTENLILDAADKLFHEKGFDGTRTADIAKEAGVSEGTLYNYFSSKTDMMMKMIEKKVFKEGNEFVSNPIDGVESAAVKDVLELTNKQWGWASIVQRSHLRKVFSEFVHKPIADNELSQIVIKNDMEYKRNMEKHLLSYEKHDADSVAMQCAIIFDTIIISMQNFAIVEDMDCDMAWSAIKEKVIYLMRGWNY